MGDVTLRFQEARDPDAADGDRFASSGPVTSAPATETANMKPRVITFHELYVRYAHDVHRFALWLSGNPEEARDITSETFVRAFTGDQEPRLESVRAYLFTIARKLHRKQWRRRARLEPLAEDLPDPATPPDEAAARRDEFEQALAIVQTLPELDRTVLLLRAAEEMSYEDIAAVTGLSVAAAKVRVFRARARLTALLKPTTKDAP